MWSESQRITKLIDELHQKITAERRRTTSNGSNHNNRMNLDLDQQQQQEPRRDLFTLPETMTAAKLQNAILPYKDDFLGSPKHDGEPILLILEPGKTFFMHRNGQVDSLICPLDLVPASETQGRIVIEAELCRTREGEDVALPFDCWQFLTEVTGAKPFEERLVRLTDVHKLYRARYLTTDSKESSNKRLQLYEKKFVASRELEAHMNSTMVQGGGFQRITDKVHVPCEAGIVLMHKTMNRIYKYKHPWTLDLIWDTATGQLSGHDTSRSLGHLLSQNRPKETRVIAEVTLDVSTNTWRLIRLRPGKRGPNSWIVIKETLDAIRDGLDLSTVLKLLAPPAQVPVSMPTTSPVSIASILLEKYGNNLTTLFHKWIDEPNMELEVRVLCDPQALTGMNLREVMFKFKNDPVHWESSSKGKLVRVDTCYSYESQLLRHSRIPSSSTETFVFKQPVLTLHISATDLKQPLFLIGGESKIPVQELVVNLKQEVELGREHFAKRLAAWPSESIRCRVRKKTMFCVQDVPEHSLEHAFSMVQTGDTEILLQAESASSPTFEIETELLKKPIAYQKTPQEALLLSSKLFSLVSF